MTMQRLATTAELPIASKPAVAEHGSAAPRSTASPSDRHGSGSRRNPLPLLGYTLLLLALLRGWQLRDAFPFTAEHGIGYLLGIAGGSMMLALLIYPMRKRISHLRFLGPVPFWFRMHMVFGLLGPLCILYHAGFHLGSANANVALFCMLTVALSGLVGRYLYLRIHKGLYGARATAHSLRQELGRIRSLLVGTEEEASDVRRERIETSLTELEARILAHGTPGGRLTGLLLPGLARYLLYRRLMEILASPHPAEVQSTVMRQLAHRMSATFLQLAYLGTFERLFSFWHVLHLPLFLMLLVTGIFHVIFVHMY